MQKSTETRFPPATSSAVVSLVFCLFGATSVACSDSDASGGEGGRSSAGAAGTLSGAAGESSGAGVSSGGGGSPSGGMTGGGEAQAGASAGLTGGGSAGTGGGTGGGGTGGGGAGTGGAGTGGAGAAGSSNAGTGGGGSHVGPWKVMMLGDSITASTCYPQLVHQGLTSKGHTNFEFWGSQRNSQSCGAMQVSVEGRGGYGVTYLPENNTRGACTKPTGCGSHAELVAWAAQKPEIVLLHFGTNDVWDGQSTSTILSAYLSVIAAFRNQNPSVIFFVSKIIKINPWSGTPASPSCAACPARVTDLANALSDSWASTNSTPMSPIWIIDNYGSGFDPSNTADTGDGVHPTRAGAQKSADATVAALIAKNYF